MSAVRSTNLLPLLAAMHARGDDRCLNVAGQVQHQLFLVLRELRPIAQIAEVGAFGFIVWEVANVAWALPLQT